MAGHSKWANIRHRKGAQDSKRGKIFSRLNKEITVAVKTAGPDPESNPRLRLAIQNARAQNMPKDNIERAIKKASGAGAADYKELTYEGYGPGGFAIFVEAATDNSTRTVASIRHHFSKFGGSLGKDGCLQFVFEQKGVFSLNAEDCGDEETFTGEMIEAGIEDIENEDSVYFLTSAMEDFGAVSSRLQDMGLTPLEAGLQRIPVTYKEIPEENLSAAGKLLSALEDDEDVQRVFHNIENPQESG